MSELSLFRMILPSLAILGSAICIVYPIVGKSDIPKWAKTAFIFLGILGIMWAALCIIQTGWGSGLDRRMFYAVQYFRTLFAGSFIGIFLTLALAGQFRLRKRR